jgi:hypothetical protein
MRCSVDNTGFDSFDNAAHSPFPLHQKYFKGKHGAPLSSSFLLVLIKVEMIITIPRNFVKFLFPEKIE